MESAHLHNQFDLDLFIVLMNMLCIIKFYE